MNIYLAIGLIVILLLGLFYFIMAIGFCLSELRENMPLNEWISFDEAVECSSSPRRVTSQGLYKLIAANAVEARWYANGMTARIRTIEELLSYKGKFRDLEFMLVRRDRS